MALKTKSKFSKDVKNEQFTLLGRKVVIRTIDERVELVIDNKAYEIRFLKNGRPYTSEYVNAMATSVRDYAERFIKFTEAQEKHWALFDDLQKHTNWRDRFKTVNGESALQPTRADPAIWSS